MYHPSSRQLSTHLWSPRRWKQTSSLLGYREPLQEERPVQLLRQDLFDRDPLSGSERSRITFNSPSTASSSSAGGPGRWYLMGNLR